MYALKDRLPARLAVVDLARRFGQGAIFDYAFAEASGDVAMVRTTVPAKSGPEVRQVVTVWRTSVIPGGEDVVSFPCILHTMRMQLGHSLVDSVLMNRDHCGLRRWRHRQCLADRGQDHKSCTCPFHLLICTNVVTGGSHSSCLALL